jgi:acetyl esterase/lipase
MTTPQDIEYGRTASGPLLASLHSPATARPSGLVMQVHGGGWCTGDRTQDAEVCEALAREGIAVLAIDFRMPPQAPYPAAVKDVAQALRWLQANAGELGGGAGSVGVLGMSSGGHLAAMAALGQGDAPACAFWIGCWPVLDPHARYRMAQERGRQELLKFHHAFWRDEEQMREGSPQALVDAGRHGPLPPALLIQGTDDENVLPQMTQRFADSYRAAGGELDLRTYPAAPHSFIKKDPQGAATVDALAAMSAFIRQFGRGVSRQL